MRPHLPLCLALSACTVVTGDGDLVTQDRDAAGFSNVTASGSVDVEVYGGAEQTTVSVTCDANLQDWIEAEVRGTTLHITQSDRAVIRPSGECFATVTLGAVGALETSGSGDVFGRILPGLSSVHTSGSGEIDVGGIEALDLQIQSSGSGDVRAEGATSALVVRASGSGDIDARALDAEAVQVRVSGSGDASVAGSTSVDARTSGSGDVHVYGDPEQVDSDSSGSGAVVLH